MVLKDDFCQYPVKAECKAPFVLRDGACHPPIAKALPALIASKPLPVKKTCDAPLQLREGVCRYPVKSTCDAPMILKGGICQYPVRENCDLPFILKGGICHPLPATVRVANTKQLCKDENSKAGGQLIAQPPVNKRQAIRPGSRRGFPAGQLRPLPPPPGLFKYRQLRPVYPAPRYNYRPLAPPPGRVYRRFVPPQPLRPRFAPIAPTRPYARPLLPPRVNRPTARPSVLPARPGFAARPRLSPIPRSQALCLCPCSARKLR